MERRNKVGFLVAVLVVCVTSQTIQLHHSRWSARSSAMFAEANQIQALIDQLESEGAPADRIAAQRTALGNVHVEIDRSFRPDLVPSWLQIGATVGTLSAILGLWRVTGKRADPNKV